MKIKEGFMLREVSGSFVVVAVGKASKEFQGVITLNETGAFLFKLLQKETTKEEVLKNMLEEYEVDQKIAQNDIDGFINKLNTNGILE